MPIVVELRTQLADRSGVRRIEAEAATPTPVGELLLELARRDPRLAEVLLDPDDGSLDFGVMVVVGGQVVHRRDLASHEVVDGDRVELHPVLAGG